MGCFKSIADWGEFQDFVRDQVGEGFCRKEELGDVEEDGHWFALVMWSPNFVTVQESGCRCVAAILTEDDRGFRTVDGFTSKKTALRAWRVHEAEIAEGAFLRGPRGPEGGVA